MSFSCQTKPLRIFVTIVLQLLQGGGCEPCVTQIFCLWRCLESSTVKYCQGSSQTDEIIWVWGKMSNPKKLCL